MNILTRNIKSLPAKAAFLLLLITAASYPSLASTIQISASVSDHEITISSLSPDTKYYYRIGNAAGFVPTGTISVTRGPYLQSPSATSITVKWSTSVTTDSLIDYRTTSFAGSASFVTSPLTGVAKPTRIWVIGDAGKTSAYVMRDAYLAYTGSRGTDVWLMLGDNAYSSGTELEYQAKVFNLFPTLLSQVSAWATFGNHDAMSANSATQTGPYFKAFKFPIAAEAGGIASNTEAYYAFDYGNIHFISLDSQTISSTLPGSTMLSWLVSDLTANQSVWTIVFFHHPPYSKGSHNSDTEARLVQVRKNVLPILEAHGVDLVLSGHSHSYERSKFIDGHYGLSTSLLTSMLIDGGNGQITGTGAYTKAVANGKAHSGTVYVTAGNSGWLRSATLNHPVMATSLLFRGSIVIDISGNRLDANAIDDTGVVRDNFTIIQQQAADTIAPVVTPPANITVEATGPTTAVALGSATATDNISVGLTPTASTTGPFAVGSHTITWSATDAAGNTGTANQTVIVQDTTLPVITVTGGNVTVAQGSTFSDPGFTASDIVDGNLTSNVVVTGGAVNTAATIGTVFTLNYNVSDAAGNSAAQKTRTVTITDGTAPVVTPPANITVEATGPTTVVALGSATAIDNVSVGLTPTASSTGPFAVGSHTITWSAIDTAGNTGTANQTVIVQDTTLPVITVTGGNVTVAQGGIFSDPGFTASDIVDGNLTTNVVVTGGAVSTAAAIGTVFTLNYNVSDAAGNAAVQKTRTVTIIAAPPPPPPPPPPPADTTAPVITLFGSNPMIVAKGVAFSDPGSSVTDNIDTGLVATVTGAVNTATIGTYILTYHASDTAGNAAAPVTRSVRVINMAPTASSASITTHEGVANIGVTPAVTDPNPGDTHTFTIITQPLNGLANIVANQLIYTPNQNFNGADSFIFRATDAGGLFVEGAANVTVIPSMFSLRLAGGALNNTAFNSTTNRVITLNATLLGSNPGVVADIYIALKLPNGALLVMQSDGSFSTNITPFLSSVPIPAFHGPIFTYAFTGTEPNGNYVWYGLLAQPGTLHAIGTLVTVPFTYTP